MSLLLAILLAAQSVAAPALSGVVRDGSGQVVPGAVVIARVPPGREQQTVTADDGRFSLPVSSGGEIVLIVRAPSNRIQDLLAVIPDCLVALQSIEPGQVVRVGKLPTR